MLLWDLAAPMHTALKTENILLRVGTQDSSLVLPCVVFHVRFKRRLNQQGIKVLHVVKHIPRLLHNSKFTPMLITVKLSCKNGQF